MYNQQKRVFSNNNDMTFHDYLANKKGVEMMKHIKSTCKTNKINFFSYNDFMNLTRTFSKNSNILGTNINMKISMDDKTTGLIYYEKILTHINECVKCKENAKQVQNIYQCDSIKSIIYAYENHFKNTTKNLYQKNIDLNQWCKKCDLSFDYSLEEDDICIDENPKISTCDCTHNKNFQQHKIKSQGRKPIFCSQCNKFIDVCLCHNRWSRIEAIRHINRQKESETFHDLDKKPLFV
jgi:hypothetical protein